MITTVMQADQLLTRDRPPAPRAAIAYSSSNQRKRAAGTIFTGPARSRVMRDKRMPEPKLCGYVSNP